MSRQTKVAVFSALLPATAPAAANAPQRPMRVRRAAAGSRKAGMLDVAGGCSTYRLATCMSRL
ncbi:MAG: hypothetical protein IIA67_02105 [Planctomycetes bacterium]|nr:hypothetical protein [Planctomycetota bacterium]